MTKPVLSIIVISYNTSKISVDCLKSIIRDKGLSFGNDHPDNSSTPSELIVIDNASSDDSLAQIKKFRRQNTISSQNFTIVANSQNLGFSQANNQGIKLAKGNYLLFLNSDTIILHSAISQALTWLSSHPKAAACTAQLLNIDKTIQPSGGFFPNLLNVFTWSAGLDDLPLTNRLIPPLHPHSPSFYTKDRFYLFDHRQDWVTGAFLLTRTTLVNQIGGFDKDYFMYAEEVELMYRLHRSFPQLETWYLVGPQVIHLGGASSSTRLNPVVNEYLGILHFFRKHKSRLQLTLATTLIRINARLRSIIYLLIGRKDLSAIYSQACQKI